MKSILTTAVLILLTQCALTQTTDPVPSKDSSELLRDSVTVSWVANADLAFAYSFNEPSTGKINYATVPALHNSFMLTLGRLGARISSNTIRGSMILHIGTFADANYTGADNAWKFVHEACAGFRITDRLWVDGGVLPSHIGFESMTPSDNWIYSHALVADLTPYYETGMKLSFNASDDLMLAVLVLNGWQNIVETNIQKSVGTQLRWTPTSSTTVNWSTYAGCDPAFDGQNAVRYWSNLYAVVSLGNDFDVMANVDVGVQDLSNESMEDDFVWYGGLIGRFRLANELRLGARIETYQHPSGSTPESWSSFGFDASSATLMVEIMPFNRILWRVEGKYTASTNAVYPTRDGMSNSDFIAMTSLSLAL